MAPVSSPRRRQRELGACLCCMSIPLFRPDVVARWVFPVGWTPERMRGTGLFLAARGLPGDGMYLTVARHDRDAPDPRPRPRPWVGGVLRVSQGSAVVPCDNVARVPSDRPGQGPPDPSVSRGARLWRRPPPPGRMASKIS